MLDLQGLLYCAPLVALSPAHGGGKIRHGTSRSTCVSIPARGSICPSSGTPSPACALLLEHLGSGSGHRLFFLALTSFSFRFNAGPAGGALKSSNDFKLGGASMIPFGFGSTSRPDADLPGRGEHSHITLFSFDEIWRGWRIRIHRPADLKKLRAVVSADPSLICTTHERLRSCLQHRHKSTNFGR